MPQEPQQTAPWEAPAPDQAPWGPEHPQQASPTYAAGSIAPKLDTAIHASEYGLKEFGGGLADVGKSIWGLMKPPEGRAETAASAVGPEGLIPYRMGKGLVDLGRQAAQVPGAIKDLAQSPDPLGTLALVAPRAGGQAAGQLMAAEGPKVASDIPFSRIDLKGGATAVAKDVPMVRQLGKFIRDEPTPLMKAKAAEKGLMPGEKAAYAEDARRSASSNTSGEGGGTTVPKARLILTPEEAQAQAQMQRIAETRASERGMQHAGGMKPAPGKISMGPRAAIESEYEGPRTPTQQQRVNPPTVSGGSDAGARMGPERRVSESPYSGAERRIRTDEEGNPIMSGSERELWQQSVFGEKPTGDIGSKVRSANPEPTRAEVRAAQESKPVTEMSHQERLNYFKDHPEELEKLVSQGGQ